MEWCRRRRCHIAQCNYCFVSKSLTCERNKHKNENTLVTVYNVVVFECSYIFDGQRRSSFRILCRIYDLFHVLYVHHNHIKVCAFHFFYKLNQFIDYFFLIFYSAEIAKQLPEDSYGLIFGVNTFIAYWLQIILTVIVVSGSLGFTLTIFEQFNVYGAYFVVLGCIYLALIILSGVRSITGSKNKKSIDLIDS